MAKNKKAKHARTGNGRPRAAGSVSVAASHKHHPPAAPAPPPKRKHYQPSQLAPYIPFAETGASDILLVGEGDLSFAKSVAVHHLSRWRRLHAAVYDSQEECITKYPQSCEHAEQIEEAGGSVQYGVDARALGADKTLRNGRAKPGQGLQSRNGGWDWIVFNFPHIGGLSKDQRRQVRANQELLVGFFEAAREVLRQPGGQRTGDGQNKVHKGETKPDKDSERYHTSDEEDEEFDMSGLTEAEKKHKESLQQQDAADIKAGGRILLTLFEGLPYSLWNVRDLARHAGFVVERSFAFQAAAYPGYAHARTLGNMISRSDRRNQAGEMDDKQIDDMNDDNNEQDNYSDALSKDQDQDNDLDSETSPERQAREAAGLSRVQVKEALQKVVPGVVAANDSPQQTSRAAGAWRGEARSARSYIFALPPAPVRRRGNGRDDFKDVAKQGAGKRKRGGNNSNDKEDDRQVDNDSSGSSDGD